MNEIDILKDKLDTFAKDRDWDQFHSPKNLSMALSGEAAELLEIFQWLSEEQSNMLSAKQIAKVEEEIADIFLYLLRLCDKTGVDLIAVANKKIELNRIKYPIDKSYGNSKKYSDL